MGKPSQSVFATAMLGAVRILTQILTSWLVITSKWNTSCIACSQLLIFPSKWKRAGHFPVYRKQLVLSRAWLYRTSNNFYVNTDNAQSKVVATHFVFLRLIHFWQTNFLSFIVLSHFTLFLSHLFYSTI